MTANYRFKVVEPISINDAKFSTPTDLNEPNPSPLANADPLAWNASTAYNVGDRATLVATHSIYQRRVAGTTATSPDLDATNWVRVGPTNKWAMFDQANNTQTQQNDSFSFWIVAGANDIADHVVFDNVDADNIRVSVYNATLTTVLYDKTINLKIRTVDNWWDYFFQRFVYRKTAVFDGLPPLVGLVFAVTVYKAGSVAKVGTCVMGRGREIGDPKQGADVGRRDYSTKDTDTFGNTTVTARASSKRVNLAVMVRSADVDAIVDFLDGLRATPALYLGAGSLYSSMVMYGFYKDFGVVIPGPALSECSIQIEGLT